MRDRSVVLELCAIGLAALVFVATFQVRPPYLDFALAAAAVALIVFSAARSRRFWELQRSVDATGARGAWKAALVFTAAALVVLAGVAVLVARPAGTPAAERFGNWHLLVAAALYLPWALLQQYIFQFYWFGRWLRLVPVPVAVGCRVRRRALPALARHGRDARRGHRVGTHLLPLAKPPAARRIARAARHGVALLGVRQRLARALAAAAARAVAAVAGGLAALAVRDCASALAMV
jgi:hypothetical protein